MEKPKLVYESVVPKQKINRDKVIIEDWYSDDEDDVSAIKIVSPVKTTVTQKLDIELIKLVQIFSKKGLDLRIIKALLLWDNAKRVNQQKISNNLKYPHSRRSFVPSGVLTRTGLVNPVRPNGKRAVHTVSIARPISTDMPISIARPDVKTSGVKNMTTAETRAVVNTSKGRGNDLEGSVGESAGLVRLSKAFNYGVDDWIGLKMQFGLDLRVLYGNSQVQIPHDSPLSGGHTSDRAEGALNLQELSVLCTNLSNRVLALESIKDAQAAEIRAWLKSVNILSMKKKSGYKGVLTVFAWIKMQIIGMLVHGKLRKMCEVKTKWLEIDGKLTYVHKVVRRQRAVSGDEGGNAEELVSTARPEVSTARPDIDAARQEDSAVEPRTPPTTTSIEVQEKASNETEPVIQDVTPTEVIQDQQSSEKGSAEVSTAGAKKGTASEEVPIVSTAEVNLSTAGGTVTYTRRSEEQRKRKDKGKAIMTESEPKKKSKKELEQERLSFAEAIRLEEQMNEEQRAQIARDEEIARQWDEEERQRAMAEAKSTKKIDWNDPSVIRYHTLKMKPKTVAQARKNMIKYLKNQGNYKISDFKGMSYDEIRPIFEKVWDFNQQFEPMDMEHGTEKMKSPKKIEEEDADTQEEVKEVSKESGAKRKKSIPRKSTRKRQKLEEDAEKEELKGFLDIIPREEVPMEVESLSTKFPIVDWKTCALTENFMYYQIFRGDGSSKNYKILSEMLEDFDRQDVEELYRLVKERYSTSRPEGYDLMLWGDLHTLFEPDEEDELWKNQHEYNVISWSLYDFCGIHILLMQNGIAIHMLTEKKYPLSQEMISKMLKKKLEVDHESSQAFELLRFIRSQVQK
ncbi:hypothetical protein Tco_1410912 [Tanacetum coccineum]